jgi:hypothetical protein
LSPADKRPAPTAGYSSVEDRRNEPGPSTFNPHLDISSNEDKRSRTGRGTGISPTENEVNTEAGRYSEDHSSGYDPLQDPRSQIQPTASSSTVIIRGKRINSSHRYSKDAPVKKNSFFGEKNKVLFAVPFDF